MQKHSSYEKAVVGRREHDSMTPMSTLKCCRKQEEPHKGISATSFIQSSEKDIIYKACHTSRFDGDSPGFSPMSRCPGWFTACAGKYQFYYFRLLSEYSNEKLKTKCYKIIQTTRLVRFSCENYFDSTVYYQLRGRQSSK